MAEPARLTARSAFDVLAPAGATGPAGVVVSERGDLQLATVVARGDREELAVRLRSAFGLELPAGPRLAAGRGVGLLGLGPRSWLALRDGADLLAEDLRHALGEAAAVTDQSDGYAVLRLSGPKAWATFEKGLGVDMHPRAFRPGDSAVTSCAQIGVILWQIDEAPTYEAAVFRSLARDFWHWLSESAAEYGLTVEAKV
jgi:heterotetrameric sarcosine oxidase gamma subunit